MAVWDHLDRWNETRQSESNNELWEVLKEAGIIHHMITEESVNTVVTEKLKMCMSILFISILSYQHVLIGLCVLSVATKGMYC